MTSAAVSSRPSDPAAPPGAAEILGIGGHVPERVLTNADLERMVATSNAWILERTGVRERRIAGSGETASVMGAAAAAVALERAGGPEVDALVVATATPDTLFPSTACLVQRRLGLHGIPAFDVSAACSGFLYALTVADALVRTGRMRTVLVVAAEALTSLVDYGDRATCVLFGDGAGAAVVGRGEGLGGIRAVHLGADGGHADLIYYGAAPDGDGAEHIRMAGKGTFRLAVETMADTALRVCADAGWELADVHHVVAHQANLRIIEAVGRRLSLHQDQLVINGDRLGNTSAASIPLALAEADAAGRLRPGDRVLCVAFGAGVTWAGMALEWSTEAPTP